jgi:hypothetical protein
MDEFDADRSSGLIEPEPITGDCVGLAVTFAGTRSAAPGIRPVQNDNCSQRGDKYDRPHHPESAPPDDVSHLS